MQNYKKIVSFIIDNLEGGYYHPDMLKDGRISDSRYGASGETMFGIDRLRGGSINTTKAGKEFWNIIDNANARSEWRWNYKGGKLNEKLKSLVAEIMYPQYEKLSKRYLSEKSRKLVESDNRLYFNFVYATWNGSGWFQRFAKKLNEAVAKGVTDKEELVNLAVLTRVNYPNSLIAQGGKKIASLMSRVPKKKSNEIFVFLGILAFISLLTFTLIKTNVIKI